MRDSELLRALKAELEFLRAGGYGRSFRSTWRPTLLIRDSILCPNADAHSRAKPCSDCKLMPLVPPKKRDALIPCHHIPLNAAGDTIANLYQTGTQDKLDHTFHDWLCATIQKIEREVTVMKTLESITAVSFKNVLFLTDLTEASQAAFTYAVAFARNYGARIYPAHAVTPFLPTELEMPVMPDILKEVEAQRRQQLENMAKNAGTNYLALITEEPIEDAVPHWITEHGIDLIVMGTHGRKGVERFLLGSTAEMIFRKAACPVLTVGPHVSPQLKKELEIKSILFATDLSRPDESAASYAVALARERLAHLTMLHVLPDTTELDTDRARLTEFATAELKKLVPSNAEMWHEPEFLVEIGDPATQIINFAEKQRPDLIVLGLPKDKQFSTHFRSGVTYKIVSSVPAAVLTIRDLA